MKKEIVFKAQIDTAGFDQQVNRIQQRLKSLQTEAARPGSVQHTRDIAYRAGIPGATRQDGSLESRSRQTLRELEDYSRKQFDMSEKILANMKKREDQIKKLREFEKQQEKGSAEQLETQRKILEIEERRRRLGLAYDRRAEAFRAGQETIESLDPEGRIRGRPRTMAGRWRDYESQMGGRTQAIGGVIAGLGTVASVLGNAIKGIAAMPREIARAQGAAIQGTSGEFYQNLFSGRSSDLAFYGRERAQAQSMAEKEYKAGVFADRAIGVGTGIGIIGGMMTGGLGLLAAGGLLLNSGTRNRLLGSVEEVTGTDFGFARKLKADQMAEYAANYQENIQNLKLQDPVKVLARERYFQNFQRDLSSQRALGMTSSRFYGQFLPGQMAGGFDDNAVIGMASSLLQAGGSTALARESSRALRFERNFGLTNISQIMGQLGMSQGAANTESSVVKILAQGTKLGLDDSDMAQEQRDFVQAAAGFIASSGAYSETAQSGLAADFAAFFTRGQVTRGDVAGAQTASQFLNQAMSDTQGPGGTLFMSKMLNDPKLKQLDPLTAIAISNLGGNISADSPIVKQAAKELGMGEEGAADLANQLRGMRVETAFGGFMYGRRPKGEVLSNDDMLATSRDLAALNQGFGQLQPKAQEALIRRYHRGEITDQAGLDAEVEKMKTKLAEGPGMTGRMQDQEAAASARAAQLINDSFINASGSAESIANQMVRAAQAASKMTEEQFKQMQQLSEFIKLGNREEMLKGSRNAFPGNKPPEAGKKAPQ